MSDMRAARYFGKEQGFTINAGINEELSSDDPSITYGSCPFNPISSFSSSLLLSVSGD
jgi:hypothetical protein